MLHNSNSGQLSGTLTYTYPSGQTGVYSDGGKASYNNGQISQMTDSISGETTVYQYDALKRVISASNSVWNETFSYDGFGNLTGKTLNGSPQSIAVNSATNQLSGPTYDLNGNMTVGAGATMTYNEDNRMSSAQLASGSVEYYYYTPDGKRFCRTMASGDTQYTLYGVHGGALGTYAIYADTEVSVYFGGRRLWQAPYYNSANGSKGAVFADRLGSNRYVTSSPTSYPTYYTDNFYPYGDVPTGTASQDQVGFATYTQDSYTRLDYADNRMFDSKDGRFNTPDPYQASGGPSSPASWNRYSYTRGDPVNRADPRGTCDLTVSFYYYFDGLYGLTDCDASLGSDINPAALAECFAVNTCLANFQAMQGGGGGVAQQGGGGGNLQGNPALAFQVATAAMAGVATIAFSPQCQGFINGALGADVLASIQALALNTSVVNAATVNTAAGVTLFPDDPVLAAQQQNNANQAVGMQGATLAQYSAASPMTSSWGQFAGGTVFYTSSWSNFSSGFALYTMLHEMLHVDGFGDAQIENAFVISPQLVAAQGSASITYKLMAECGQ